MLLCCRLTGISHRTVEFWWTHSMRLWWDTYEILYLFSHTDQFNVVSVSVFLKHKDYLQTNNEEPSSHSISGNFWAVIIFSCRFIQKIVLFLSTQLNWLWISECFLLKRSNDTSGFADFWRFEFLAFILSVSSSSVCGADMNNFSHHTASWEYVCYTWRDQNEKFTRPKHLSWEQSPKTPHHTPSSVNTPAQSSAAHL